MAVFGCGATVPIPLTPPALAVESGATNARPGEEIEVAVPFYVIAHRGASGHAPENTLPAFALAHEMGASDVELDVRMSRDDVLVLFHDSTLDRKTELTGRAADYDAETLLATDIGSWFDASHPYAERRYAGTTIPTLAALFEAHGRDFHYHVELKGAQPTLPEATLAMIDDYGLMDHVTITSFNFDHLKRVREINPEVRICLLLRDGNATVTRMSEAKSESVLELQRERIDHAARAGFTQVGVRAAAMTPDVIEYARSQHGLEVRAWGVGSSADMEHVLRAGANGMTIDWPDRLLSRLRELGWDEEAQDSK